MGIHPYAGWGLAAFAAYAVAGFFALGMLRTASDRVLGVAHSGWLWTWTVAIGLSLRQIAEQSALADGWRDALTLLPAARRVDARAA